MVHHSTELCYSKQVKRKETSRTAEASVQSMIANSGCTLQLMEGPSWRGQTSHSSRSGSYLGCNVIKRCAIQLDSKGDNDGIAVADVGAWKKRHRAGAAAILQVGGVLTAHAAQL